MIYFIQCGQDGPIKIGYAADIQARMKDLQAANPYDLVLLGSMNGDHALEHCLHKKFKKYHRRNEWFEDCPEIRDFIAHCHEFDYKSFLGEKVEPKSKKSARKFDYRGSIDPLADTAIAQGWTDERLYHTAFDLLLTELLKFGHVGTTAYRQADRYARLCVLMRQANQARWDKIQRGEELKKGIGDRQSISLPIESP